jgi:hypothetical protein
LKKSGVPHLNHDPSSRTYIDIIPKKVSIVPEKEFVSKDSFALEGVVLAEEVLDCKLLDMYDILFD